MDPVVVEGFNMTLLHTQDTYGSVVAVTKLNAACAPFTNGSYPPKCFGGLGRRMSYIDAARSAHTNVLLVDGGNFLTGTTPPLSPPVLLLPLDHSLVTLLLSSLSGSRR